MDPFLGSIGLLRLKNMNKPLQMISKVILDGSFAMAILEFQEG
ncbi:hypothetical protein CCACVL1_20288 [Corchorus capsularis]|uniref:Uncharacterized protein n=1 Tax=Corchorus capsularis TaxID=210143 RepID=A0A1R3HBV9_COCAP|nr:hypothetical protein CCACVL1_20288 [Corchorus capsularis]